MVEDRVGRVPDMVLELVEGLALLRGPPKQLFPDLRRQAFEEVRLLLVIVRSTVSDDVSVLAVEVLELGDAPVHILDLRDLRRALDDFPKLADSHVLALLDVFHDQAPGLEAVQHVRALEDRVSFSGQAGVEEPPQHL